MKAEKLMAIDPSLTCSGWALFDIASSRLLGVGKVRSLGANINLSERLADLQAKIEDALNLVKLKKNDVLICEDATSNLDPGAAAKVEQVRGIFETLARSRSVLVPGRIHPRTVQYELMGLKGKQLERVIIKQTAASLALRLYSSQLQALGFDCTKSNSKTSQDIFDAILLGSFALTRIQNAKRAGQSIATTFAKASNGRRAQLVSRNVNHAR